MISTFEKDLWKFIRWINALPLAFIDWNIFKTFIFDRDFKFLFDFWKAICKSLDIDLLIFIIYYLQINNQLKRINQTFEITLRFHIIYNFDVLQNKFSVQFREILNNFTNASIKKSSNEIAYEMKLNKKFDNFNVIAQS